MITPHGLAHSEQGMHSYPCPLLLLKLTQPSCDFCYRRKIKCDERRLCCTQRISQSIDCTFTAPSRKIVSSNRQVQADLQARFHGLETSLQRLSKRLEASEAHADLPSRILRGHEDALPLQCLPPSLRRAPTRIFPTRSYATCLHSIHVVLALVHRLGLTKGSSQVSAAEWLIRCYVALEVMNCHGACFASRWCKLGRYRCGASLAPIPSQELNNSASSGSPWHSISWSHIFPLA